MQQLKLRRQMPGCAHAMNTFHSARVILHALASSSGHLAVDSLRRRTKQQQRAACGRAPPATRPMISANSPFALRRYLSICHSRSCAVTYPCANKRSSWVAASMCGTPCESRRTVTAFWTSPARCAFAIKLRQRSLLAYRSSQSSGTPATTHYQHRQQSYGIQHACDANASERGRRACRLSRCDRFSPLSFSSAPASQLRAAAARNHAGS